MRLHGYYRSSAAYRVRIALNLKGIAVEHVPHHLRKAEHLAPDYVKLNPQGILPTLEADDGRVLTQSLAILEWLDETYPEPRLLPADPWVRAQCRAVALAVVADIHPVQNLKVMQRLQALGLTETDALDWARWVISDGLAACERLLADQPGPFAFGATPTLADLCLIPQMFNARRYNVDIAGFPRLLAIEAACRALPAFIDARPDRQVDAE